MTARSAICPGCQAVSGRVHSRYERRLLDTAVGGCHVAGADAVSRYELGLLIAARDGLDQAALPAGLRTASGLAGAIDVQLNSTRTQSRLASRLRGAREFLAPALS